MVLLLVLCVVGLPFLLVVQLVVVNLASWWLGVGVFVFLSVSSQS